MFPVVDAQHRSTACQWLANHCGHLWRQHERVARRTIAPAAPSRISALLFAALGLGTLRILSSTTPLVGLRRLPPVSSGRMAREGYILAASIIGLSTLLLGTVDTTHAQATSSAQKFGQRLKELREKLGLSQRKVASVLEVDESTVARLEAGTRLPPRHVAFYERLRNLPGVREDQIRALLRTDNAPRWLVGDEETARQLGDPIPTPAVVSTDGIHVELHVSMEPGALPPDDLEVVKEAVRADVELCLRDLMRRRAERSRDPVPI